MSHRKRNCLIYYVKLMLLWDVVAIAWLLNDNDRFMIGHLTHAPLPKYDKVYYFNPHNRIMKTIYYVDHATLASDLI